MKVKESTLQRCKNDGDDHEELFKQRIQSAGYRYNESTNQDDWYRYIDCYVDGYGVDVKANRYLDTIWLEHTNINGNKGWLRGDAQYIAMFVNEFDAFCIFNREDLLGFILDNVKEKTTDKTQYLKYYTREKWGRKDLVVKVRYNDIKHLELKKL